MKAAILSVYPDHRFPHVLFYSTLLAVLSIAAVGLVSSHVLNALTRVCSRSISWPVRLEPGPAICV